MASGSRQSRQFERQSAVTELVMSEGSVRIEDVAERFGVSLMTVHRDLDELESRGILRKTRGVATATSTSVIESSDVYRSNRQAAEKEALAVAAMDYVEPGQAIILDDSTTVMRIARHLGRNAPITVITNALTLMNQLRATNGITLLGLGGLYYNWCSAFMGPMTRHEIAQFQADTFIMSTSAIINDVVFHQHLETLDTKRAMFDASNKRVLLADHTKFARQALHAMVPLRAFDAVIVDDGTSRVDIERMRDKGINVVVAPIPHTHRSTHEAHRGIEERSK
jgi:DeoR/GlpR family transcriptional regulator of sugar metabolism